ncbi:MAG: 6-phosphofructokinase, partial [Oscillospiraceae bacterium]|nr:6-phosphofructokinase [Oscillospiraceae bacterium]
EMDSRSVSDIINRGGTILQTARCLEFTKEEGMAKAVSMAKVFGMDAIVVIGGDGSFKGARDLCRRGVKVVGIPGTIDNDIGCSDYTIGYDTALNTVQDAIDKIRDTAYSHERCSIVEVMGRHAGYIALNVGIATGAEAVVFPEQELDMDADILLPIIEGRNRGKRHYIVILAEGVGGAVEIAAKIEAATGIESRATILGHIQRGGSPTVKDRVVASRMGVRAVELLREGTYDRVLAMRGDDLVDLDISEALAMRKTIGPEYVNVSKVLSI